MQWDDSVNSPPTTTGKSSFFNSFEIILFNSVFQSVNFWSKMLVTRHQYGISALVTQTSFC